MNPITEKSYVLSRAEQCQTTNKKDKVRGYLMSFLRDVILILD